MPERHGNPEESIVPPLASEPGHARVNSPLRLSDVRLSELIPALDGFLFLFDADGRILDFRAGPAAELFVEPAGFLGRSVSDVLPADVADAFRAVMRGADHPAPRLQYRLPYADGERVFEANFTCLGSDRWIGLVHHVSERVRAQEELRANEDRLQEAVRVSGMGFVDHDHRTNHIYWSPEQRQLFGWPPDEPVRLEKINASLHPEDRERSGRAVQVAHDPSGDGRFDIEFRVLHADGRVRWLSTRSQTSFEGEGPDRRPVRTVGATVDITERVHAERTLREREERFRALIEEGLDLVLTMAPGAIVTFASPALRAVLGYAPEDLIGRSLLELLHPDDVERVQAARARLGAREVGLVRGVARLRHRDGTYRVLDGVIRDLVAIPAVSAYVLNARDITEQRRLEERLQQAERLDSIGRLAGGIAHDFNNMLTAILGYTELLQLQAQAGEPLRLEDLREIRSAAERARDLTSQLLAFARRQVAAPRCVNLNDALRTSERMLQRLLGEDVELACALEPCLEPIRIDPTQLQQVILNLAINARDAMRGGGRLTLQTANVTLQEEDVAGLGDEILPGPHVVLIASDTGSGIPASVLPHVFEPFFTTKPAGEGTGLGLSTVYGIVRQNGGHIRIESEPGAGARFTVYFPRAVEAAAPEAAAAPVARSTTRAGEETVLLVEDDAAVRGLIAQSLRDAGYQVLAAADPIEALEAARAIAGPIPLLLTDVVMPGMSGQDLAERLQSERPDLKVLYVSGYTSDTVARRGVLEAGVHFRGTPFSPSDRRTRVRDLLDGVATPGLGR